jgi:hypothetical protein
MEFEAGFSKETAEGLAPLDTLKAMRAKGRVQHGGRVESPQGAER